MITKKLIQVKIPIKIFHRNLHITSQKLLAE